MLKRLMVVLVRWGWNFTKKAPSSSERALTENRRASSSPKGKVQGQAGTNQAGVASGQGATTGDKQLPRTGSKSQANLSILGLALIGLVGMVHRKKGQHETDQI